MNKYISGITLMLFISSVCIAHDTTHIHPMITKRVSDLIRIEDNDQAYLEFYLQNKKIGDRGIFWGKDRDLDDDANLSLSKLLKDNLPAYGNDDEKEKGLHYNNVIDGVVQEDAPLGKAVDHFFHATTGNELSLNGFFPLINTAPSPQRAMPFFIKAIDWYSGYTLAARKRAYFIFGQSLHHVEDMSSPAHVHNDPHLTFFSSGKDSERENGIVVSPMS